MKAKLPPQPFKFGLIGYPLGHSISPQIHHAALEFLNLKGTYTCYEIQPTEEKISEIKRLFQQLREGIIHGLNVTIPYKALMFELVDAATPQARQVGAVNTLFQRDGQVIGDNTDIKGFLTDFKAFVSAFGQKTTIPAQALVIGGGGSARSVVYGLLQEGWNIIIAARNLEQAQNIVNQWHNKISDKQNINAIRISEIRTIELQDITAVINTTPVGMWPNIRLSPWPLGLPLPEKSVIYDLIYNPVETALMRSARLQGLPARSGGGMLIEQAALAFERWTGYMAPRAIMRQAFQLAMKQFNPEQKNSETYETTIHPH